MLMQCKFIIRGTPRGQGRPRFTTLHGYASAYKKPEDVQWEKQIRDAFLLETRGRWQLSEKPIEIEITAMFEPPKRASKKQKADMLSGACRPTKPADVDNICKSVLDAIQGVCFKNDASVVSIHAEKHYSSEAGLCVTVREIDGANSL